MQHTVSLSFILVFFWILNSGHYNALLLFLGAISIAIVIFIAHRMDVVDHESQPIHLTIRMPGYWLWLARQIIQANIMVTCHIWRGNKTISPTQFNLKASQKTDMGKVIYANSITLTPGTVAIDLVGDNITVHALTQKTAEELKSGEMDKRVSKLEN